jgi:hypothetical protein
MLRLVLGAILLGMSRSPDIASPLRLTRSRKWAYELPQLPSAVIDIAARNPSPQSFENFRRVR